MDITRQDLIQICDKFLQGEIDRKDVEDFAWALLTSDDHEWDDDVIAETLFEWDNEEINFPITKVNMQLWKKRLNGRLDELPEHNFWSTHIEKQKAICKKYSSEWRPINQKVFIGVSNDLQSDPIHGMRHPGDRARGWFIWTGEYSTAADFFQPICAMHLLQIRPQIIKYLGLATGFRFLADSAAYEDVWYDEKLKQID